MAEQRWESKLVQALDAIGRRGFAFAFQMLGNRDDALDAVQGRERIDPNRDLKPWFYRVLRNRCIDMMRSGRLRRSATLEREPSDAASSDPSQDASRAEELARLRRELDRLPEEMQEIIMLRDYNDLSYAEIAEVLEVPKGTVMSRLHRARSALRERMLASESDHE